MAWSFRFACSEYSSCPSSMDRSVSTSIPFVHGPLWVEGCAPVPAGCQELAGALYRCPQPPAWLFKGEAAFESRPGFFPRRFPVFSSLSTCYFVIGKHRINSKREGREGSLCEGCVSGKRERQGLRAQSLGSKDWRVSDQCKLLVEWWPRTRREAEKVATSVEC